MSDKTIDKLAEHSELLELARAVVSFLEDSQSVRRKNALLEKLRAIGAHAERTKAEGQP